MDKEWINVSIDLFDKIMESWFGSTGDYTLIALAILVFFVLAFVLIGIDVKFSLIIVLPLAYVFTVQGWFSTWFSIMFWFITIGASGYLFWTSISDR